MIWLLLPILAVWLMWRHFVVGYDDREVLLLVDYLGDDTPAMVRAAERARERQRRRREWRARFDRMVRRRA